MIRLAVTAALAALLAACATTPRADYALRPASSDGHDLSRMSIDTNTILESRDPSGVVSIRATSTLADYGASFIVAVRNPGEAPVVFGPENISVQAGGAAATVYTAKALDEKVKRKVGAMMKAESRSYSLEQRPIESASYEATQNHTYNNYGGCGAGNGGCGAFNGGYHTYRLDEDERAHNYDVAQRAALILLRDGDVVKQQVLRTGAVKPGETTGGIVVVTHPRVGQTLDFTITFGGQVHRFSFEVQPRA